jgi:hypothetical protein
MKQLLFLFAVTSFIQNAQSQLGPIELMAGDKYLHYQHSLSQPLKAESRFGWQHIATLIKRYEPNEGKNAMPDELMNQAYVTFRIHSLLTMKSGLFYTNAGGYTPTAGLQFFLHKKDWVVILAPRVDLNRDPTYELFTMVEFNPSIRLGVKLYARLQAMSNFGRQSHNRSYQLLRVGVDLAGFQFGGGVSLDEYGTSRKVHHNTGFFVRRML